MERIEVDLRTGEQKVVPLTQKEIEEIQRAHQELIDSGYYRENIKQQRASAYASEADPLFFEAQRGEINIQEWEAKVEEIRQRFPYTEEKS